MWLRSWKVLKSRQWSPALRSTSMKPFITTSSLSSSSSSSAQGSWHKESWRGSVFPQMLLLWLLNLAATLAIPQCPKLLKGSSVWWRGKNKKVKGFIRERVRQPWLGVRDEALCFAGALSQLFLSRILCIGLTLELLLVTLVLLPHKHKLDES